MCKRFNLVIMLAAALFSLFISQSATAQEELIYENTVMVGQGASEGSSISWIHDIPAAVLAEATRVEAVVGAYDVDYPVCGGCEENDACEHDRLYVNNQEIGLLSGENNASHANPINVPLSAFVAGINNYRVDNEDVDCEGANWYLRINDSTLKFYKSSEPEPGPTTKTDLIVTKRQSRSALLPGDEQKYTIILENSGDQPLRGFTVTDTLDENLTYESDTSGTAPRVEDQGRTYIWFLNRSLGAGEMFQFEINTKVAIDVRTGTWIRNQAAAENPQVGQTIYSNAVTARVGGLPVDSDEIRIRKRVLRRRARIGKILRYRVDIENTSRGVLYDVQLKDLLPNGFNLVKGSTTRNGRRFSDPTGSRRLIWNLGVLPSGTKIRITYQVVVGTSAAVGQNRNTAIITGSDGGGAGVEARDSAVVMLGAGDVKELGKIKVTTFLDPEKDGLMGSRDEGLADITIIFPPSTKRKTDKEGVALFENIDPGHQVVAVDERTLAEDTYLIGNATKMVTVLEGESAEVSFAFYSEPGWARLVGRVFYDKNRNNAYDDGEPLMKHFKVILDGKRTKSAREGAFVFSRLTPGKHKVEIKKGKRSRISKDLDLKKGNNGIDIALPYSILEITIEGE